MNFDFINLEFIYNYIVFLCDYTFNYCPIHYQMLYFYFPILYIYIFKKKPFNQNTSFNYIIILIKFYINFFKKLDLILIVFKNFFLKIIIYIIFFKNIFINDSFNIIYKYFKKTSFSIFWKPIFKKTSYFGLFAYIRSKWYK